MINTESIRASHKDFNSQKPYRFIAFDNFLDESFARSLLRTFPRPDSDAEYFRFCVEDGNKIGSNYANPECESWPEAFRKLDVFLRSSEFMSFLESTTEIKNLIFDNDYQGGGIRASQDSTFLPVHLDFNRHPRHPGWHRRLNLLIYFNENWKEEYDGHIQVHRSPASCESGQTLVTEFLPVHNRAFLFETSEISWHGFRRLTTPEGIQRLAFSIYFYTTHRPEGNVPYRNTEYVEPWLPESIDVSAESRLVLEELLRRRDDRIRMLYELRRDFDSRYTHLWSEYEYYLKKFHAYREKYGDIPD